MKKTISYILILMILVVFGTTACGDKKPAAELLSTDTDVSTATDSEIISTESDIEDLEIPKDDPELPGAILFMIDNHSKARPQSGLDKADVVFEVEAEGGITRYMALFYNNACEKVGPIRSCRYYFAELALGLKGIYTHMGASTDGYQKISDLSLQDVDGMKANATQFWRSTDRKMPHNCYTSTETVTELANKKGYTFSAPALPAYGVKFSGETIESGEVYIAYNTSYNMGFKYNGECYDRYVKKELSKTNEGVQITADTIFIMETNVATRNTDPVTSQVDVIGSGKCMRIVDNIVTYGTWEKKSAKDPLVFKDQQGNEMTRKFGHTWVEIIDDLTKVSFNF